MIADLIFTNGRIMTMDSENPWVSAVAVRDGKIIAAGDDQTIKTLQSGKTPKINLDGRAMIPGLVDAHVHFQGFSIYRQKLDLDQAKSLEEVLGRVEKFVQQNSLEKSAEWIEGRGWSQDTWINADFPTAKKLDRIIPNRPACFRHKSGHAAWVNNKALQLAGVSKMTMDPAGGKIQRDESGKPTGILFETAMNLVTDIIPKPTISEIASAMKAAQQYCWEVGLTGLHDFDGRSCFQALQTLEQEEELGLRIIKNIPVKRLDHAIGVGLYSGFGNEWLRIGSVKIFADGALGPRTASMVEPYENNPNNYGLIVTDKEEMMAYAQKASENGLSVTVHAIGDRANHDILDVYQVVREEEKERGQGRKLRHRIEHVQILHPADVNRLAELDVIASMQPVHATSDMVMAQEYWGNRARFSYAWRTVLNSGAPLVFGSDAPIEKIDPLPGIHAAVTRCREGSKEEESWYPEQRLTLQETLRAFTLAAAETSNQHAILGSITPGKYADFTVFDRNIFELPSDELIETQIAATVVGGDFKYQNFE